FDSAKSLRRTCDLGGMNLVAKLQLALKTRETRPQRATPQMRSHAKTEHGRQDIRDGRRTVDMGAQSHPLFELVRGEHADEHRTLARQKSGSRRSPLR